MTTRVSAHDFGKVRDFWIYSVVGDTELNFTARLIAVRVALRHADPATGLVEVKREDLVHDLDTSIGTVNRSLRALERRGWVQRFGRGNAGFQCLFGDLRKGGTHGE